MFYLNVKAKQSILWENLLFFMVSYDSYKTENFWFSFLFSFFKEHRSLFKSSWDDIIIIFSYLVMKLFLFNSTVWNMYWTI